MRNKLHTRDPRGGFTLIEVMVAMLIIALISTIGVKGFRSVTKSNLREATAHFSGAIRYMFDRASITGKYQRLVIDLNEGQYWAEQSDDKFYAPNQAETVSEKRKREEKEAEADEDERKRQEKQRDLYNSSSSSSSSSATSFDMSKLEVGDFHPKRPRFAAFKETALKPVKLKKLRIRSVYTPRLTEPVTSGRAYLYFYPLGQTEPAIITLSDESGENIYSLVVHPITGRVRIYNQEIRPNLSGVRYDDEGNQVVQ